MTTKPGYVWDEAASEFVGIGQAAVLAPIAYQASQPSSPATGDIWIDSDDDVPSVDSTLYYRWTKTMSGGETSLSGNDNNSLSLRYTPGYESVFINGVLQGRNLDYTATSGSTIAGLTALASNDIVMVESIVAYSVGDTYTQSQMTSLLDAKSPVSTTGAVLLNTTTFSAVSSVSINNVFSATYDNYLIDLNVTSISTNGQIGFRIGSSGTPITTSTYYGGGYYSYTASTSGVFASAAGTYGYLGGIDAGAQSCTTFRIMNPYLAQRTGYLSHHSILSSTGYAYNYGGSNTNSTSYTDCFIVPTAGTITGTVRVYGYK